jgi:hypothetical protein
MNEKALSNSDLARLVWGETKDAKGYPVAKNRDRIGVYLKGEGFPEPRTLAKLAEALGTTAEELAPEITAATVDRERPELAMTAVGGDTDKMHVQVNALLPLDVAVKIMEIVAQAKKMTTESVAPNGDDANQGQSVNDQSSKDGSIGCT